MELKTRLQLIWWRQKWKPLLVPNCCSESIDSGREGWIFESPRGILQQLAEWQLSCTQRRIQKVWRQEGKTRAVVRTAFTLQAAFLSMMLYLYWTITSLLLLFCEVCKENCLQPSSLKQIQRQEFFEFCLYFCRLFQTCSCQWPISYKSSKKWVSNSYSDILTHDISGFIFIPSDNRNIPGGLSIQNRNLLKFPQMTEKKLFSKFFG